MLGPTPAQRASRERVRLQAAEMFENGARDGEVALLDAAHRRLDGNIVLIWDQLDTHLSAAIRRRIGSPPAPG